MLLLVTGVEAGRRSPASPLVDGEKGRGSGGGDRDGTGRHVLEGRRRHGR